MNAAIHWRALSHDGPCAVEIGRIEPPKSLIAALLPETPPQLFICKET